MPVLTYLPIVSHESNTIDGQGDEWEETAQELFVLMRDDPNQKRRECIWDKKLAEVAGRRVHDMLNRNYFDHIDPDGNGPNYYVRLYGYKLPGGYSKNGNNVESIGLNYKTPERCWWGWLQSPGHRTHVLGEGGTFRPQTHVGIAYMHGVNGWPKYWALISAPPMGG